MNRNLFKKMLLIITGSISLALGVIGLIVPVLPTTPFLLLSCFCYLRSSKKLYDWLTTHRIFGTYIYNYVTYKAVTKKAKIMALCFLWSSLMISMLLIDNLHVRLLLAAVGIGVTVHLHLLKTMQKDDVKGQRYEKSDQNAD